MEIAEMIGGAVGLLGGLGGLAAFLRARAQNNVDASRLLHERESSFAERLSAEVGRLSALVQVLDTSKDKLEGQLSDQGRQLERLQVLDEQKTRQIENLQSQNLALSARVDEQSRTIAQLDDERAKAINLAQLHQSAKEFLERENNELRREVQNLITIRDRFFARFGRLEEGHASTIDLSSGGGVAGPDSSGGGA